MSIKEFMILYRSKVINVAPFARGDKRLETVHLLTSAFQLQVQRSSEAID